MTTKEKTILLKDLSSRLPYGVYCKIEGIEEPKKLIRIEVDYKNGHLLDFEDNIEDSLPYQFYISEVKLFLRSYHSLTESEQDTFDSLLLDCVLVEEVIDWCNEHCVDYRRLIERGLAVQMPDKMYQDILKERKKNK